MTFNFTSKGNRNLAKLTGNLKQLASVRRIILDDGPERGDSVLIFSSGGGLCFWVQIDRSMDVGHLWWDGSPISWRHPTGFNTKKTNEPDYRADVDFEHAISGFLVTCGLENVRQPRNGFPLHGTLPLTPANLISYGEDWDANSPYLFAEGDMTTGTTELASFRLHRRIEAPIGGNNFSITDRIENIGKERAEMMVLYHNNFGFPAFSENATVSLNGTVIFDESDTKLVSDRKLPFAVCYAVEDPKEFCVTLDRPPSEQCTSLRVSIEGNTNALPYVQLWNDPRPKRNYISIEPTNCGRADNSTSLPGTFLEPGEVWSSTQRYSFV